MAPNYTQLLIKLSDAQLTVSNNGHGEPQGKENGGQTSNESGERRSASSYHLQLHDLENEVKKDGQNANNERIPSRG